MMVNRSLTEHQFGTDCVIDSTETGAPLVRIHSVIFTFLKAESIHYEINFGSDEEVLFQLESLFMHHNSDG